MNTSSTLCELTRTELLIVQLIAYEYSSKEIANFLFVSNQTIYSHRANILLKLDVKNTAGLVRRAIERNLLQPKIDLFSNPRISGEFALSA